MNAEVVKRLLEVWHVWLEGLAGPLGPLPLDVVNPQVLELLAQRQRHGAQLFDVFRQGGTSNFHQGLVQLDAHEPLVVLLLEHALVGVVLGAVVGPHRVKQLVLRLPPVLCLVGEQDGGPPHLEEMVRNAHASIRPVVVVLGDVLRAHDEGPAVLVALHELVHERDADDPRGAAHPPQVVHDHVGPHLEVVDDHRSEGGRGIEQGAVHDDHVHVLRLQALLAENRPHAREHHLLGLLPRGFHGRVLGHARDFGPRDTRRNVRSLLAHAAVVRHLLVETRYLGVRVVVLLLPDLLKLLERYRPRLRRLEAMQADQVNRGLEVRQPPHPAHLPREVRLQLARRRRHVLVPLVWLPFRRPWTASTEVVEVVVVVGGLSKDRETRYRAVVLSSRPFAPYRPEIAKS
mmetsp:Transcript_9479/g.26959  ORF Transcript_9479/g.26959 Transcript_9479/m.26959 type:complete len:402 (+) Transcript_9479:590-1795(+)